MTDKSKPTDKSLSTALSLLDNKSETEFLKQVDLLTKTDIKKCFKRLFADANASAKKSKLPETSPKSKKPRILQDEDISKLTGTVQDYIDNSNELCEFTQYIDFKFFINMLEVLPNKNHQLTQTQDSLIDSKALCEKLPLLDLKSCILLTDPMYDLNAELETMESLQRIKTEDYDLLVEKLSEVMELNTKLTHENTKQMDELIKLGNDVEAQEGKAYAFEKKVTEMEKDNIPNLIPCISKGKSSMNSPGKRVNYDSKVSSEFFENSNKQIDLIMNFDSREDSEHQNSFVESPTKMSGRNKPLGLGVRITQSPLMISPCKSPTHRSQKDLTSAIRTSHKRSVSDLLANPELLKCLYEENKEKLDTVEKLLTQKKREVETKTKKQFAQDKEFSLLIYRKQEQEAEVERLLALLKEREGLEEEIGRLTALLADKENLVTNMTEKVKNMSDSTKKQNLSAKKMFSSENEYDISYSTPETKTFQYSEQEDWLSNEMKEISKGLHDLQDKYDIGFMHHEEVLSELEGLKTFKKSMSNTVESKQKEMQTNDSNNKLIQSEKTKTAEVNSGANQQAQTQLLKKLLEDKFAQIEKLKTDIVNQDKVVEASKTQLKDLESELNDTKKEANDYKELYENEQQANNKLSKYSTPVDKGIGKLVSPDMSGGQLKEGGMIPKSKKSISVISEKKHEKDLADLADKDNVDNIDNLEEKIIKLENDLNEEKLKNIHYQVLIDDKEIAINSMQKKIYNREDTVGKQRMLSEDPDLNTKIGQYGECLSPTKKSEISQIKVKLREKKMIKQADDNTIKNLTADQDKVELNLMQTNRELEEAKKELDLSRTCLEDKTNMYNDMSMAYDKLKQDFKNCEDEFNGKSELLQNELVIVKGNLIELNEEKTDDKKETDEYKDQIKKLTHTISEYQSNAADLVNRLKMKDDSENEVFDNYQKKLEEKNDEFVKIKEENSSLQAHIEMLKKENEALEKNSETFSKSSGMMLNSDMTMKYSDITLENEKFKAEIAEFADKFKKSEGLISGIKSKDDEIEKLRDDQEKLEIVVGELKAELEGKKAELKNLEEVKVLKVEQEMKELKADLEGKQNELDGFKAGHEAKDSEMKELKADLETKDSEMKELKADLETKDSEMKELKADLETKDSEMKELKADLETKDSEMKELKADLETKDSEMKELKADLEGKQNELDGLKAGHETKDSEMKELKADLEGKQNELDGLKAGHEAKDSKMKELKADLEGKQNELDGLKAEHEVKDSEVKELKASFEGKQDELDGLKAEHEVKDSEVKELKASFEGKQNELDGLKAEHEAKDSEVKELKADLESKQNELDGLKAEHQTKDSELKADLESKQNELDGLKAGNQTKDSKMKELKADLETKDSEMKELKTDLESKQTALKDLISEQDSKDTNLKDLKAIHAKTQTELKDLKSEQETKDTNLQQLKKEFDSTQAKLSSSLADQEKLKDLNHEYKTSIENLAKKPEESNPIESEENQEQKKKVDEQSEQLKQLGEMMSTQKGTKGKNDEYIKDLMKDNEKLAIDIEAKDSEFEKLVIDHGKLQNEVEGLKADLEDTKIELGRLKSEQETKKAGLDSFLKAELECANTKLEESTADQQNRQNEMNDLRTCLEDSQNEVKQLKADAETIKLELGKLKAEDEKNEKFIDELQEQVDEKECQKADLNSTISDINEKLNELQRQIDNNEYGQDQLYQTNLELNEQLAKLTEENENLIGDIATTKIKNGSLIDEIIKFKEDYTVLTTELSKNNVDQKTVKPDQSRKKSSTDERRRSGNGSDKNKNDLENRLEILQNLCEDYTKKMTDLEKKMTSLQEKNFELEHSQSYTSQITDDRLAELTKQLEREKTDKQMLELKINRVEEGKRKIVEELDQLKETSRYFATNDSPYNEKANDSANNESHEDNQLAEDSGTKESLIVEQIKSELQEKLEVMNRTNEKQQEQLESKNSDIDDLQEELEFKNYEISELRQDTDHEIKNGQKQILQYKNQLEISDEEKKTARNMNIILDNQLKNTLEQIAYLTNMYNNMEHKWRQATTGSETDIVALKNEISDLSQKSMQESQASLQEIEKLKSANSELLEQNKAAGSNFQESETSLEDLKKNWAEFFNTEQEEQNFVREKLRLSEAEVLRLREECLDLEDQVDFEKERNKQMMFNTFTNQNDSTANDTVQERQLQQNPELGNNSPHICGIVYIL